MRVLSPPPVVALAMAVASLTGCSSGPGKGGWAESWFGGGGDKNKDPGGGSSGGGGGTGTSSSSSSSSSGSSSSGSSSSGSGSSSSGTSSSSSSGDPCAMPSSNADCASCVTAQTCGSGNAPGCCDVVTPSGFEAYFFAKLGACGCAAGSTCNLECSGVNDYCAMPGVNQLSQACLGCVDKITNDPCGTKTNADCKTDTVCKAWSSCIQACP